MLKIAGVMKLLTDIEVLDGGVTALSQWEGKQDFNEAISNIAVVVSCILGEDKAFVEGYIKSRIKG